MGKLKNLWIVLKSRKGKAISKVDLFSYCESLIQKPPVPQPLLKAFNESFVRSEGQVVSLSEWYRHDHLIPALNRIAEQPTWHLQRAECFKAILDELHWRSWQYCFNNSKTELGKGIILQKLKPLWPKATNEELTHYLHQFYLVTLTCSAALSVVGKTFFKLDNKKEMEFELYMQYQRDIMQLDTSIMDVAYEHIDDEDAAYRIAEWKDVRLNPITEQMYRHLSSTKDQIIQDVFDINDFSRLTGEFQRQKAALASEFAE